MFLGESEVADTNRFIQISLPHRSTPLSPTRTSDRRPHVSRMGTNAMKYRLLIPLMFVLLIVAPTITQQREKKKGPPQFKPEIEAAMKAFDAKNYGACSAHLNRASIALTTIRRNLVLAAFPDLGPEFKIKDNKQHEEMLNNPMAGLMPAMLAGSIERTYTAGSRRLNVKLMLDSPMAKTFIGMFGILMRDKNTEIITYNTNKAALKSRGSNRYELKMVLNNAHYLEVDSRGFSDDELLKVFCQEAVDRIAKAATN
jgi:hypothetical protein